MITPTHALSPEQIASFQERGCLVDAVLFDDDEAEALHLPWPPRRLPDALVGTSSPSCQTGGVTIRLKPSGSPPRS